MKGEKGITLTALAIYIILFTAILAILGSLSNYIYGNLNKIDSDSISSEEFNKFNTYFVKDVKKSKVATVENKTDENKIEITFESGSKYTYIKSEKAIYKETIKIARNITKFDATIKIENNKKLIDVNIATGKNTDTSNFEKNIKYVLKYW